MLAPHDQVEILRRRCVFGLTRRQLQVLGTCALGYSVEETAAALGIAKPTVFRHLELLESRIFGLTDLVPSRCLLAAWAHVQRDCCTSAVWKMIENRQLFESLDQPRHLPRHDTRRSR